MNGLAIDPLTIIHGIAAAGLVLALWSVGVLLFAHRRAARDALLRERLGVHGHPGEKVRALRLWHEGQEALTFVASDAGTPSLRERLEQVHRDAGYHMSLRALALLIGALAGVSALGALALSHRVLPGLVAPMVVLVVAWFLISRRIGKRRALFDRQFVDGLELCARALRSGHTLLSAFRLMSEEIPMPVGGVFADICQQQSMGVSMEDALKKAAALSGSAEMKLFTASLRINLKTGGQLADVMEGIAFVIRERMRLGRRFRTLTAQTQFSKKVLIGLPFVLFAVLNAISPSYIGKLYEAGGGQFMLGGALFSLFLGWFVMNRMADLKV